MKYEYNVLTIHGYCSEQAEQNFIMNQAREGWRLVAVKGPALWSTYYFERLVTSQTMLQQPQAVKAFRLTHDIFHPIVTDPIPVPTDPFIGTPLPGGTGQPGPHIGDPVPGTGTPFWGTPMSDTGNPNGPA